MSNIYRMTKPVDAVTGLFHAPAGDLPRFAAEVHPGNLGLVIADGTVHAMRWGFPVAPKNMIAALPLRPNPVTSVRDGELETGMWADSFHHRRCLIPMTAWAEPEGAEGAMTRTWYSPLEESLFAVAGIWRPTVEWGDAFSVVMVGGPDAHVGGQNHMPVILAPEDWEQWTHGTPDDAIELCRVYGDALIVDRTDEPWFKLTDLTGSTAAPLS
ncbi:putative SOS response-associated peptidase YedK [Novosphingobium sp. PhB165]|uniref:SOS response-associated peptidase family protein n=1 Tax=Novosphingobium sp. PhB165 TaxID=2485105 RepID=UPI00104BAEE4|nr:SOS response-associated peptidase family protein [Novosphingobium sp. PhB165]TCM17941.1 putative SOS response-associated peptidase YedK [Novosphingobium sp. PhB165]